MTDPLESELRAAFAAAAANVHPARTSAAGSRVDAKTPAERAEPAPAPVISLSARSRGRWVAPAVAAATAAAFLIPIAVIGWDRVQTSAAAQLEVTGPQVTVGGVRFPVPEGWQPEIVDSNDQAVTVCVSADPTVTPCSGVTVRIAVPGGLTNAFIPVPNPAITDCDWLRREDVDQVLAGRPAEITSTSCTPDGPRSLSWYLTDGSLSITTPPDQAIEQARLIAAGMDLTEWSITGAEPIVTQTGPTT